MSIQHTDVAAYSFGLLEEQDRLDFEAHLAQCESCAAELAELSAMADLFTGVDPVEPGRDEPDDAVIGDLMRKRARAHRHRVRQQAFLAAACVVLAAGGAAVGVAVAQQQTGVVAMTGQQHRATNAGTGVTGTVGLLAKPWGTQVTMDLAGVRGPLVCQLVAVSRSGERRVIAGWTVPAAGYGVPGHPDHLLLVGSTAIVEHELSRIDIDVVHGRTLLSIPI